MHADLGRTQLAPDADVITRAVAVPSLAALAVIHVVDLPGTLGPDPLVGIGYLGIIAAAVLAGGAIIVRSGWLAWAAAGGLAIAAMAGYLLTRGLPGGFLGDHGDVGNLAVGWARQARLRATGTAARARSDAPRSLGSRTPDSPGAAHSRPR
jgi:hypothetical protein